MVNHLKDAIRSPYGRQRLHFILCYCSLVFTDNLSNPDKPMDVRDIKAREENKRKPGKRKKRREAVTIHEKKLVNRG